MFASSIRLDTDGRIIDAQAIDVFYAGHFWETKDEIKNVLTNTECMDAIRLRIEVMFSA